MVETSLLSMITARPLTLLLASWDSLAPEDPTALPDPLDPKDTLAMLVSPASPDRRDLLVLGDPLDQLESLARTVTMADLVSPETEELLDLRELADSPEPLAFPA